MKYQDHSLLKAREVDDDHIFGSMLCKSLLR